jgi:limonene-1,2-epoxide hydrolase
MASNDVPVEGPQAREIRRNNDHLVRTFLQAWERRDTDFIVECFADDAVYHSTPLAPIVGKAAIREFVAGFESVPPGRLVVHRQIAGEHVVMNERTDHILMNGVAISLPICGTFEIEGSRIKAWREYFDLGPVRAAYDR